MAIKSWFWAGGETDAAAPGPEFGKLIGQADTRENWNVLEIHDWPRFLLFAKGTKEENQERYEAFNALGHLLTAPGVPVLYYGIEQGLNGDCHADKVTVAGGARRGIDRVCARTDFGNHARYRQDMFAGGPWRLGSVMPSINALAGIGRGSVRAPAGGDDPYLDTSHDLFKHAAKMIAIRKSCATLRTGGLYFRAAHGASANAGGGFYAFSRVAGGDEILVMINPSKDAKPVAKLFVDKNLHSDEVGARYVDLVSGKERATVVDGGGALAFGGGYAIPPHSVRVFVAESRARLEAGGGTCR